MNNHNQKNSIANSNIWAQGDIHVGDIFNNSYLEQLNYKKIEKPKEYFERKIVRGTNQNNPSLLHRIKLLEFVESEQYLILLGEAGMGKSLEMQNFGCELYKNSHWFPLLISLGNYSGKTPLFKLSKSLEEKEEKVVLLLDGMDETEIASINQSIKIFTTTYPKSKVIVSCRKNEYKEGAINFKKFYLDKLTNKEIHDYLDKNLAIDKVALLKQFNHSDEFDLLKIPFYLILACQYFNDNKSNSNVSKSKLIECIINKSLDQRLREYSHYGDNLELRELCIENLKKLAFVMECMGINSISKSQFKEIIKDTQVQNVLLNKSSLITIQNEYWKFSHRNFQEFLASLVLSKAKNIRDILNVVAFQPNFKKLKLSWQNTLAFLICNLDDNVNIKAGLIDWLQKKTPNTMVLMEKNRIPIKVREQTVKQIFNHYKKENMPFPHKEFSSWHLADFGGTPYTLRFLINEFTTPNSILTKSNALQIVLNLTDTIVHPNFTSELRNLLLSVAKQDKENSYIRYLALSVLNRFYRLTLVEIQNLFDDFFNSEDPNQRFVIYQVIGKNKLQAEFMPFLINRYHQYNDNDIKFNDKLGNEDWELEDCLIKTESEEGLLAFFKCYCQTFSNKDDYLHSYYNPLMPLVQKAIKITSDEFHAKIFDISKLFFVSQLEYWEAGNNRKTFTDYLSASKRTINFIEFILSIRNEIKWTWARITSLVWNISVGNFIVQEFERDNLTIEEINLIQGCLCNYNIDFLKPFNKNINTKSTTEISLPFRPNFEELEHKRFLKLEKEKSILFDKIRFLNEIEAIFLEHGRGDFNFKNYVELLTKNNFEHQKFSHVVFDSLGDFIRDKRGKKSDIISTIDKYWETFSIRRIKKFLIKNKEIKLTRLEINTIKKWCTNRVDNNVFENAVTFSLSKGGNEQMSITKDAQVVSYFIRKFDLGYSSSIYLDMLVLALYKEVDNTIGIFPFVISKVEKNLVNQKVLENISSEKTALFILDNHLDYIRENQLIEGIAHLIPFLEKKSYNYHVKQKALATYIGLHGDLEYLENLTTKVKNEEFKLHLFITLINEKSSNIEKLATTYFKQTNKSNKLAFAPYLIKIAPNQSLSFFKQYIIENKKSPFKNYHWQLYNQVEDFSAIKLLLDLLKLGNDDSISEDIFDNISNLVESMLFHLALHQNGKYYVKVRKKVKRILLIEKLKNLIKFRPKYYSSGLIKQLQYFIRNIDYHYFQKQNLNLKEGLLVYKKFCSL